MIWIILPAALAGLYIIFIVGPAVVAGLTIFRCRPGMDLDSLTEPGADFFQYRELLRSARDRLLAIPGREVAVTAPDGVVLHGVYRDLGAARTAIFVHGYRSDPMVNFAPQADRFSRAGYNLLMITQRGHTGRGRELCAMGLKERYDVLAWNGWALSQAGVEATVLYGASMGAATLAYASDALDPRTTAALILDCGYESPYEQIRRDCVKRHLPARLMMPVIRAMAKLQLGVDLKESTLTALARTAIPCFFLHGTQDRRVPYACGRAGYEACAARKAFFTAGSAGHVEAFFAEPERAAAEIFAFIPSQEQQEEDKP